MRRGREDHRAGVSHRRCLPPGRSRKEVRAMSATDWQERTPNVDEAIDELEKQFGDA